MPCAGLLRTLDVFKRLLHATSSVGTRLRRAVAPNLGIVTVCIPWSNRHQEYQLTT
jgi:hypothetical protein